MRFNGWHWQGMSSASGLDRLEGKARGPCGSGSDGLQVPSTWQEDFAEMERPAALFQAGHLSRKYDCNCSCHINNYVVFFVILFWQRLNFRKIIIVCTFLGPMVGRFLYL